MVVGLVLVVTIYLVVIPLVFLLWTSFRSGPIGMPAELTLANYARAYANPGTYEILHNTLIFALGSAAIALLLGIIFAWLVERTNLPGKSLLYPLFLVPIAIPGVLFSIAWVLLLSPGAGIINLALKHAFQLDQAPLNIYNLPGMIFLEGLHLTPITFLMMAGSFRRMDPALEEASDALGAGFLTTLNRITLRVLRPSILGALIYVVISAMESFEIPGVIGMRAGIQVLAFKIYLAKQESPPDYGMLSTLAILLLAISALLIFAYSKFSRDAERYATITGKAYRPKTIDLGRWKFSALAFVASYFLVTILLPLLVLLWASLLPVYQAPSLAALSRVSLDNYRTVFEISKVGLALKNTLYMVLLAPTITMLICSVLSWVIVKSRGRGRKVLDLVTFIPHAIPGIVTGVALMWVYIFLPVPIYGTIWILLIAYITSRIAFGTRVMNAAMTQLHKELEEASYVSGGSWFKTFRKITLPLLLPALVNGWIFSAIVVTKAMGSVIMIYSHDSIVLSVLVWELWSNGDVAATAALGVMLIFGLMGATYVARKFATQTL
ncbi:MAG: sugB 2 [Deltaproteobacteria bacterium]|nr:sugB 2 [Deltaproteobacteria bacterium]